MACARNPLGAVPAVVWTPPVGVQAQTRPLDRRGLAAGQGRHRQLTSWWRWCSSVLNAIRAAHYAGSADGGLPPLLHEEDSGPPRGIRRSLQGLQLLRARAGRFAADHRCFTFAGTLLCIIPGLVVAAMYKFTYLFIVDKRMDFWPAMQASHAVVKNDYFGFTMFLLLMAAGRSSRRALLHHRSLYLHPGDHRGDHGRVQGDRRLRAAHRRRAVTRPAAAARTPRRAVVLPAAGRADGSGCADSTGSPAASVRFAA